MRWLLCPPVYNARSSLTHKAWVIGKVVETCKRLQFADTVLWLCPSLYTETLNWLSSLPIVMQKSFWWWQCNDRYIISLPLPPPPYPLPPFSPSLISRTVSVDVKPCRLTRRKTPVYLPWTLNTTFTYSLNYYDSGIPKAVHQQGSSEVVVQHWRRPAPV